MTFDNCNHERWIPDQDGPGELCATCGTWRPVRFGRPTIQTDGLSQIRLAKQIGMSLDEYLDWRVPTGDELRARIPAGIDADEVYAAVRESIAADWWDA